MTDYTFATLTCLRCHYEWFPRQQGRPMVCPSCQSRKWDCPPMPQPPKEPPAA